MEKLCVIKKVLPHLVAPDNVQRFRDEAMVAVRLSHGNLVTVFDAGHSDDQIYLAMDFIEGKDLLATWNRCAQRGVPFPIEVAVYIVKELARGLGYAHAFGGLEPGSPRRLAGQRAALVHRRGQADRLRPGDVDAQAAAHRARDHLRQAQLPGARAGAREPLDGRTDIYVCGILLWELLTGQQLFPVKPAAFAPGHPRATRPPTRSSACATRARSRRRRSPTACRPSWIAS